jgi:alkylhydroperoxidase family enzyme
VSWVTREADVLSLRPEAFARARELEAALRDAHDLDPHLIDLVRSRVDHILGVPGASFDPNDVGSEREAAALTFAEQYVMDPSGITDARTAELNELFSEPELTTLTFSVAVYDALARVQLLLGLDQPVIP